LTERDQQALDERGGVWHRGTWKGVQSSNWRMTPEAVALMDDTMIDNINKMVGVDDILWHLGDFALPGKRDYVEKCEAYRERIQCRDVRMIWGNHDQPDKIKHLFSECHNLTDVTVNSQMFVLCHYAMAVWDGSHRGKSIMIYGHSHSNAEEWLNNSFPGRRSMDVGVDNAYKILGGFRPFSFEEIIGILKDKPGHAIDHHIDPDAPSEESLNS